MEYELIFVVDENDSPLPPLERKEVIAKGLWRRACGGIVIGKENRRVLCQKRSDQVDQRPGLWVALYGGKSAPGEAPALTAQRELQEELGLTVRQSDLIFYKKFKSQKRKQFEYLYSVDWAGDISQINFDKAEVSEVAWHDISSIVHLLKYDENWYSYGYDVGMIEAIGMKKETP